MLKRKENKTHLSKEEEFEIFKLVIDKFLWVGTIALVYGVYLLLKPDTDVGFGFLITLIGATILLIFTSVITREFNYKRT